MSFPSDHADRSRRRRQRRDAAPRLAKRSPGAGQTLAEVVAQLSARLLETPSEDIGLAIDSTLRALREQLPADRVTLHLRSADASSWIEVARSSGLAGDEMLAGDFEARCAEEASEGFEGFELSAYPVLATTLSKGDVVLWRNEEALPAEAERERTLFREHDVASLLVAPMIHHGALIGFLEVAALSVPRPWSEDAAPMSRIIVDLLAAAIARKRSATQLDETRRRLQTTERLEIIGRLASGIAHDFNNYLTAILGYGELLDEELGGNDVAREELGEICNAAERASTLVEQILGFHRQKGVEPRPLDLASIVAPLAKIIDRVAGDEIDVVYRLDEGLDPVVVDPSRFDQVVLNLVANARDAMAEKGGRLTVETRGARIEPAGVCSLPIEPPAGLTEGRYIVLGVRDTGCGMDDETRARLFDPFFTTKRAGRGTGIGLSTVAKIVEECGGAIRVESEPGRGSGFHVFLPAAGEVDPRVAVKPAAREIARGAGETILLVETEPVVRGLFARLFESFGYRVLAADTGSRALETCANHRGPIHLLVTDLGMPRASGRELARQAALARPGLRVLFTSSHREQVLVDEGVWDRSAPLVEKPFARHELATRAREALAKSPA